jgi:type 1 glutamine amidotransferase
VTLHRFGDVTVAGVPFFVMDPVRAVNGLNLLALKGGPGATSIADEFPRRLEIPTAVTAASLHFLGGVGGWAWPAGSRGAPVMKVVVQSPTASRGTCPRNGEHFADAFNKVEVPQSATPTSRGANRCDRAQSGSRARQDRLESYDTDIVPVTVAITAGSSQPRRNRDTGPPGAGSRPEGRRKGRRATAETKPLSGRPADEGLSSSAVAARTTTASSGTSTAPRSARPGCVNYTEDRDQAAAEIGKADVAVVSVNRQFFDTPEYRKALLDFAAAGKGLVMLHAGTWYIYPQWPELNATIVGGGARGHDRIAAFSVNAVKPEHPVMKDVPASFTVEDELYYTNAEPERVPQGTAAIEVLAETSPSVRFKKPHPAVWVTSHPTARIVGITLGHDQRVHDLDAFKTLLVNAVRWAGRQALTPFSRQPAAVSSPSKPPQRRTTTDVAERIAASAVESQRLTAIRPTGSAIV